MARKGLNAKLTYPDAKGRAQSYSVRCSGVRHGIRPVFTESAARIRRVVYPHLSSLDKFSIDVELISQTEYISLSKWLTTYINLALKVDRTSDFPLMMVSIPSRNFSRVGAPISGFEWGDRAARMSWGITIAFETSEDLRDNTGSQVGIHSPDQLSQFVQNSADNTVTQYFYPAGPQLSGSDTPDTGTYAVPITLDDILVGDETGATGAQSGSDTGLDGTIGG